MPSAALNWTPMTEHAPASAASDIAARPRRRRRPRRGAERFVDFLARAGQRLWQFMPLGPVGLGNSPYAASSAFPGNPLLVALDRWWNEAG